MQVEEEKRKYSLRSALNTAGLTLENIHKYISEIQKGTAEKDIKSLIQPDKKIPIEILKVYKYRLNNMEMPKVEQTEKGLRELMSAVYDDGWEDLKVLANYMMHLNYSELFKGAQTRTPEYSCAVPFVLHAYKKQHKVPYQRWNKGLEAENAPVSARRAALGNKALYEAVTKAEELKNYYKFTTDQLEEVFEKRFKHSSKGEEKKNVVGHPIYWKGGVVNFPIEDYCKEQTYHGKAMLIQGNLWAPNVRLPGEMILDPFDWDHVPEPYPFIQREIEKYKEEREKKNKKAPRKVNTKVIEFSDADLF